MSTTVPSVNGRQFRLYLNFSIQTFASCLNRHGVDLFILRKERESMVFKALHFLHRMCLSNDDADPDLEYVKQQANEYYNDPGIRMFMDHILPQAALLLQQMPTESIWIINSMFVAYINDNDVAIDIVTTKLS